MSDLTPSEHLAECPEGINVGARPSGNQDAPFSLCPLDDGAVALVGLYSADCLASRRIQGLFTL